MVRQRLHIKGLMVVLRPLLALAIKVVAVVVAQVLLVLLHLLLAEAQAVQDKCQQLQGHQ